MAVKLIRGCVLLFAALCLLHYFTARPLWLDEGFVYKNIIALDYGQLFGPLEPTQSFPRVYLIAIKAFAANFDNHVLALRFFSLLCMGGAFLILARLLRTDSRNDWLALLAVFAMTASYKFSYYAAELKPYSMDVLVVAIFTLYVHYQRVFEGMAPRRKDYVIVALLPLLIFFSYAGLFVFWLTGWNFLLQLGKNRKVLPLFLTNALVSLCCLVLFYWFDVRHSITLPGVEYWDGHFICYDSWVCFWDKFGDGVRRMVVYPFDGNKPQRYAASLFIPFCMFALLGYGFRRVWKDGLKFYHLESVGLFLFIELFVLGSLQLYPFTGERLTLFFSPFIIYMTVKGLGEMVKQEKLRTFLLSYFTFFYMICLLRTLYQYLKFYYL
ncbi:MAG TPA: hypothetical protein VI749_05365 [Candidatus Omnitrophota bacterium]|nr:hypothetical protein [Candidatus Omnitrophota bacterium]